MNTIEWLTVALKEAGIETLPEGLSNSRIEEYHRSVGGLLWNDKVPWCSSFLNWCMLQAGIAGTNSALARSWLTWGRPLSSPRIGCIVVLWREAFESEKGHVGLFLREDENHVYLWGGNQLGAVRERDYLKSTIIGMRWPSV